jgi:hypothetical protein
MQDGSSFKERRRRFETYADVENVIYCRSPDVASIHTNIILKQQCLVSSLSIHSYRTSRYMVSKVSIVS